MENISNKSCAISFYSYKGGSGRSTTLVNTVKPLIKVMNASPKEPILIVDTDVESAGLTYFFNSENRFCGEFGAIHSVKILNNDGVDLNSPLMREKLFGMGAKFSGEINVLENCNLENSDKSAIRAICEKYGFPNDADTAFGGITVPSAYRDIIQNLVAAMLDVINNRKNSDLGSRFDFSELVKNLKNIERNEAFSSAEKARLKRKVFIEFLPSPCVIDVSEYFGAQNGTVKFLGVNVSNPVGISQTVKPNVCKNFVSAACKIFGYKAVVFDSGAGTQSSAHILHTISDVLVYCLRPSEQFKKGTEMQFRKYSVILNSRQKEKQNPESRTVILLPTCVPDHGDIASLTGESLVDISKLGENANEFIIGAPAVDVSFCEKNTCLNEVPIFKCHEMILGVQEPSVNIDKVDKQIKRHYSMDDIPAEAANAIKVYKKLAERIASCAEV